MKILRKFIGAILIVVFCLAFAGCGKDKTPQLATPENVACSDEGVISWDGVENADYYIVVLNDIKYRSNTNSYTVGSVVNDFTFAVIAAAESDSGYKNSEPSETQTFKGKGVVVPPAPVIEGLTVTVTGKQLVGSGKSVQLTATVLFPDGDTNKRVTWSIVEGRQYASVDGNGKFTAKEVTEDHDVTVRATCTDNSAVYADIVICVACQPTLTDEMLDGVKDDYISFEGYMDIDLYTFALSERYIRTYQVPGISTHMNGERWHASYIDTASGYTNDLHYRNVDGDAQQVALSLMNDEEYYPMTDEAGEPVSWTDAGLYNNFKSLKASDFEFDENEWRYFYKGTDEVILKNMVASANPYEFEAKRFGMIIEDGELLGIYAESKPSYTVIQGYKSYEKLYAFINCGEDNVKVPEIRKFESNPATAGGGKIDHETLRTAISNMQNLESYKLDFTMSAHMATGYSISGFVETVMEDNYYFEPYDVNTSTNAVLMKKDAQYGYIKVDGGYNSYNYDKENERYVAARAFDGDISRARASFAFAPEIFTAWATGIVNGKETQMYYVDESMCHVASTFYYGVGNDMPLYGLFAMMYPYLADYTPFVVVQEGHIVETGFFYFLGDMYGEVVIDYSDFTDYDDVEAPESFKAELFENFEPRVIPASWDELTVIDETIDGNDEEKNAATFFAGLFGSAQDAEDLPFFTEVLGDTFGFGLATYDTHSGMTSRPVQTVILYYDVPLDVDRSINGTIKRVQEFLVQHGFEKNEYGEYVKGNVSVLPYDSSLDFLIYVWKTV